MATKKKVISDRGSLDKGTIAAASVVTQPITDKSQASSKMIPVRVNGVDYNHLKGLFGSHGLPLARAGALAIFYIAEQLEAGRLSISKAGIIDRRG